MSEQLSTKPTILQVLPALEQGGVERGTIEIDNALVAAGWNSIVVSSGGRMVKQLKGKHLQLGLNTKNPLKILFHVHILRAIIKENNVDIVHARSRAPAWSAYLAVRKTRARFVTTFHGTYSINNSLKRWYNSVMTKGEKIIAVSDFIKRHIIDNYRIAEEKITTIHRGADVNKFNPDITPIGLGIPLDKKIVMLPGRITRWKGQHVFVEAMRGLDATGVIIGDVESTDYMRELEATLPDNIIILPGTPDLGPVLANASVVVSASIRPEAFGRIAIEAQALGKPVVATNIGGALETVIDNETGRHVPPDDPIAMRQAIVELLEKGSVNKDKIIANATSFSTSRMCEKTLKLYQSIIDQN